MACSNTTTAWSCTNYKTKTKEEIKTYPTAEEFEKAE
jgi:hypothetical protein